MDLGIKNKQFIVTGATSGFGLAISRRLLSEGARVIAVARTQTSLETLRNEGGQAVEILCGDVTESATIRQLIALLADRELSGILVNAGGPPAKSFMETTLEDWDTAYRQLLRWKVELSKAFIPVFERSGYGRFLYIESASQKQPMDNLVLSTSLRLAVAGFVKTMSNELASKGITANILAPGYHDTAAVDRIFKKMAETKGISVEQARKLLEESIPVKKMGRPEDLASLAVWLLSPMSAYVTGQTISVDGGSVKYIFG